MHLLPRVTLGLFLLCFSAWGSQALPGGISWVGWTPDLFARATAEKKLVILDLEAVWCHWCHVMEKETYSQPKVRELIAEHFIAVRVDQDARPDLSRRYEDYGWPATIFFDSSGRELAKRSGFLSAGELTQLLTALVKNPVPEEAQSPKARAAAESPFLGEALRKKLVERHGAQYDGRRGGWGVGHKFLWGDSEEFSLREAWRKSRVDRRRAFQTLDKALVLVDPIWGGAYQYSAEGWNEPHFEKIASTQGRNLFLYSLGYLQLGDARFLKAARDVHRYLKTFMASKEGGFFTSQDADAVAGKHSAGYFKLKDAERRRAGVPRIDEHRYARENGWYIQGLCALYAASGDETALADATRAADWVTAHRSLEGGGFRHDEVDPSGPYLSDTLAMGRAFLSLYEVTGDRAWLAKAKAAAGFIAARFAPRGGEVGFVPDRIDLGPGLGAEASRDDNTEVARWAVRLHHYSGDAAARDMAVTAMKMLAAPDVAVAYPTAGVLLAEEELAKPPVHMTIVGAKSDAAAKALFQEANRYPHSYKRVEWWDKQEGDLPNADVKYPAMKKAAAYACSDGRCSLPAFDPQELRTRVDQLYR